MTDSFGLKQILNLSFCPDLSISAEAAKEGTAGASTSSIFAEIMLEAASTVDDIMAKVASIVNEIVTEAASTADEVLTKTMSIADKIMADAAGRVNDGKYHSQYHVDGG